MSTTLQNRTDRSEMLNQTSTVCATFFTDREEGQIIYGIKNAMIWNPSQSRWIPLSSDDDKFLVTHEDFSTARDEFFTRWKQYCLRRFKRTFFIEERNKYFAQ